MKYIIPIMFIFLASILQLTFPAALMPGHLVIDFALVAVVVVALFVQPITVALWMALLAGLLLDLWQPAHFGIWTLACVITALVAVIIHSKVLPRVSTSGFLVTAAIAITAGIIVLYLISWLDTDFSLKNQLISLGRIYLLKIPLDLAFFWLAVVVTRRIIRTLNPAAHA